MFKLTLLLFFIFAIFIKIIVCWSDEPHMLIALIAYHNLKEKDRRILNKIFSNYKEDKDFNDPISGAVWPDHIKINDYEDYGVHKKGRFEILDIFNEWHFIQIPFNPTKVFVPSPFLNFHKGKNTASGVLKHIYKTLVQVGKKANHGTYFSYNFYLRFFIHIFGDVHQPLHTINFFNRHFPYGDKGGLDITITYNGHFGKLHHLCDNIFNSRRKHWPYVNMAYLQKEAFALMNMFPPNSFGSSLEIPDNKIDYIDNIIAESHQLAIDYVYSQFNVEDLNKDIPVKVDQHFVVKLKGVLNKQMVLCGYRLSYYLKDIIANIPDDL